MMDGGHTCEKWDGVVLLSWFLFIHQLRCWRFKKTMFFFWPFINSLTIIFSFSGTITIWLVICILHLRYWCTLCFLLLRCMYFFLYTLTYVCLLISFWHFLIFIGFYVWVGRMRHKSYELWNKDHDWCSLRMKSGTAKYVSELWNKDQMIYSKVWNKKQRNM